MDATKAAMGHGRPFAGGRLVRTPGAPMERTHPERVAIGAGCRARFLFAYFLFAPGGDPRAKRK